MHFTISGYDLVQFFLADKSYTSHDIIHFSILVTRFIPYQLGITYIDDLVVLQSNMLRSIYRHAYHSREMK